MLELVVIADDLTGAADTTVRFCPYMEEVWLFPGEIPSSPWDPSSSTALGVHTDSRNLPPHEAHNRLSTWTSWLIKMAPALVYKKVDSCMRGNVGVEVQALLEALAKPCAFIAPAYPEMGRTTLGGVHLVYGVPVSQSEMARDPLCPVGSSELREMVSGPWKLPVAHLSLELLEGSQMSLQRHIERLVSSGIRQITFDATQMRHLRKIAAMALKMDALPVGSAGLATALAQSRFEHRKASREEPLKMGLERHLFVVGSNSPRAKTQMTVLLKNPMVCRLSVPWESYGKKKEPWDWISGMRRGCILLTPEQPRAQGPDPKRMTQALALAAKKIVQIWSPQTLFLTGGETAQAALTHLAVESILLLAEPLPGVVLGRAHGGSKPGMLILTKAGAFGEDQIMARILEGLIQGFSPQRKRKEESDEKPEGPTG
ncbi:MAG: four-carbon acid sugar kinase family protein [bacterium]